MSKYDDDVDFSDLTTIEITKKIGPHTYVIREASGDAACKYRNALMRSTKLGPDGKPSAYEGLADADPLLVSMCLFRLEGQKGNEKYIPVSVGEVRAWPNKVQSYLVDKVRKISELGNEDNEEELQKQIEELQKRIEELREKGSKAKNGQLATTDGSV